MDLPAVGFLLLYDPFHPNGMMLGPFEPNGSRFWWVPGKALRAEGGRGGGNLPLHEWPSTPDQRVVIF